MQQTPVPSVPPNRRVRIPLHKTLGSITRDENDIPLELVGVEQNVGISPPRHELAARSVGPPLLPAGVAPFLSVLLLTPPTPRRSVCASQAGGGLDEPQSSEEALPRRRQMCQLTLENSA